MSGFAAALRNSEHQLSCGDSPVAGSTTDFGDFLVARFTAGGKLDLSFGGGVVATDVNGTTNLARNLVVQPNGALVVSGEPVGTDPGRRTDIARYDASGSLDTSFNGSGKLAIAGAQVGRGLALQGDGRLVLVGSQPVQNAPNDFSHFAVARLDADGTFDNSFGTEAIVTTSITGVTDVAHAVVLQPDGRIVVAGEGNLINPNFALARFNTDGTLDTTFAVDGKIVAGSLAVDRANGYGLVRVNP